jgi:hypothetical protein
MFRGYPPDESNYFTMKSKFDKLLYPFKYCELTSIELVKIGQFSENASFLVNVAYRQKYESGRKVLIKKKSISTDHPKINRSLKIDGLYLNIMLEAKYNDTYKRKMLNNFTKCQKYDPSYKFSTECEINIDLTSCEQTFNLDMTDPQKNQYILKFKFSIITETLNLVKFNFKTNPFKEVIMDSCKNDYKYFGLNMIEWKQEEKGSRANHLIHVNLGNKSIALYDLEMMHVISRKWSSISLRDIQNGNLLASSHLIGVDQLPNINQLPVKYNEKILAEYPYLTDIPCLDDRYEKAMLVRNLRGDFAIIKGKTG